MANVNNNNKKNIKAFQKVVNVLVKSSKNRIDTLTDGSGNSFNTHTVCQ